MASLDLNELAEDPRFATGPQRVERREELLGKIRAAASKLKSAELGKRLTDEKVPFGFVNNMEAVFQQPAAQDITLNGTTEAGDVVGGKIYDHGKRYFYPQTTGSAPSF